MTHKLVEGLFVNLRRKARFFLADYQKAGVLVKTSSAMAESEVNGVEWSLNPEQPVFELVPVKENEGQCELGLVVKSGRW